MAISVAVLPLSAALSSLATDASTYFTATPAGAISPRLRPVMIHRVSSSSDSENDKSCTSELKSASIVSIAERIK